jgi:hypothetical protein
MSNSFLLSLRIYVLPQAGGFFAILVNISVSTIHTLLV